AFFQYYYYTDGTGCSTCHDNDPFNYTPFLQSVGWKTGGYTLGSFERISLDGTLVTNGTSHLVSPEAAACTTCHRITSGGTCTSSAADSFGAHRGTGYEPRVVEAANNPDSQLWWLGPWMRYQDEPIHDRAAWDEVYGAARDHIEACC